MKVLLDVGISPRRPWPPIAVIAVDDNRLGPRHDDGTSRHSRSEVLQSRLTVQHAMSKPLHLPDLTIRGFRGIDQLTIPRLGRVTLIAGKNGVGKTTVLEAVNVFAARGRFSALLDVLTDRNEVDLEPDDDNNLWLGEIDYGSLFYSRNSSETHISIGPQVERLLIDVVSLEEEVPTLLGVVDPVQGLSTLFRDKRQIRWELSDKNLLLFQRHQPFPPSDKPEPEIVRERLGPGIPNERDIARIWDSVALTKDEDRAVQALKLIIEDDVLGVAVIGDSDPAKNSRRTVVRIGEQDRPVPLRSLGDGAVRLFGVALALANSRGGFLLIDEAENGIHHTVQYEFWKLVLRMAHANDVQVLATTHSWDCVRGFAYAAAESEDGEGMLVRLDRDDRGLRAVEYSKEGLLAAAEQGIEVR